MKQYIYIKDNKIQGRMLVPDEMVQEIEQKGIVLVDSEPFKDVSDQDLVLKDGVVSSNKAIKEEMKELLSFLSSTDYIVIRNLETGKEMPLDVKEQRQAARDRISQIREILGS